MSITDRLIKIEDKVGFLLMMILIAGVFAIVLFSPAAPQTTGQSIRNHLSAIENPSIDDSSLEQLIRTYFVVSALINIYTNNALSTLYSDSQKYGAMQKPAADYFTCNALMRNTAEAKMLRNLILGKSVNSTYVPELYCFEEFTTWDMLKFELLEKQCKNANYDYGLDANIFSIYEIERKMLNEGCIAKTRLVKILGG